MTINLKNQIVHLRDEPSIWWGDEMDPYELIEMAGGSVATEETQETLTVINVLRWQMAPDTDYILEEDFWPECIKQAFPDYKEKAIKEYFFFQDDDMFFDLKHMIETIKEQMDSDPFYYCNATIATNGFEVDDIDSACIVYSFCNDGGRGTKGTFFAFDTEEHLDQYLRSENHSGHNINIRIQ